MNAALQRLVDRRKVAILTFEVFWIVVFLLDAVTGPSGADTAAFVYANF